MSKVKSKSTAPKASAAILAVPDLPLTEAEKVGKLEMAESLLELAAELQSRNLHIAVLLAQQAQCGRGPLVEHFTELGRRFAHLLSEPAPKKPALRAIEGGVA